MDDLSKDAGFPVHQRKCLSLIAEPSTLFAKRFGPSTLQPTVNCTDQPVDAIGHLSGLNLYLPLNTWAILTNRTLMRALSHTAVAHLRVASDP